MTVATGQAPFSEGEVLSYNFGDQEAPSVSR
jgi:hypothetical protein